jgi:cytochrome b pre-mRNA-processing protein 3
MLRFLFRGLTAERPGGAAVFDAITARAREPHWYVEGKLPDTLDGRFAVLATLTALVMVRLEADGAAGDAVSVALTERFIQVMESEHRELGLGDPTLGKTVRKLVGKLARRTELWRSVDRGSPEWTEATRESLYKDDVPPEAIQHSGDALKRISGRLAELRLDDIQQGKIA